MLMTFSVLKELSMKLKVFPSAETKELVLMFHVFASVLNETKEN